MKTLFAFFLLFTIAVRAQGDLRPAEQALQVKQFEKAVELLDGYLASDDDERKDYATYLKALALFHQDKKNETIQACDEVIEGFDGSDWKRKALYLKSSVLIGQKKFEEAEAIYEAEANRLFSSDRKKALANVLVEFGDEMAREPEEDELDAPPADFNKAIQLYQKALTIEIDRELRDTVTFKIAHSYQKLNQWNVAEQHFQAYLKEFDPKWAGPVGSPERFRNQMKENPLPAGAHWKEARFHLVEAQLAMSGQVVQIVPGQKHQALQVQSDASRYLPKLQMARQNAEDLLELLGEENAAMKSDTHWLLVRSFNLPHPAPSELDRGVQSAEKFIKEHPKHPRATDTSRLIALTYRNVGRTDQAIAAFESFAAERNFTFVPEETKMDPKIKTGVSCNETFNKWTMEAVFMIGQLRFEQKKYEEAIQQWREYIARYPNGPQWSNCQSGIINAKFQVGLDAVEAKEYGVARKHFEEFLNDHPLDGRARQILFTMGQIEYSKAQELEEENEAPDAEVAEKIEEHYRNAIEEWERLVSKYPNTEESSLALYRIGVVQEEKLGELEQALATYQRLKWGGSAGNAQQRFQTMTNHALSVRTERTFRSNEDAFIEVTSRNAPKLKFDLYRLNLEAYFRKMHGIGGVEDLDIDLIQPDETWEQEVDGFEKYKPITQRIKIPFDDGKPGVCVVKVSEEDFEATTLVVRSDIELITKSSRRELFVYAQNMVTKKPAANVSIIASNGKEVFCNGKTGKDGVFRKNFFETLKDASGVGVFASGDRGIASGNLSLRDLNFSSGLSERGYIYTDKPVYRPGETVNIRGIIRMVEDGSYEVPKKKRYSVRVLDPKGRMLKESVMTLTDFGAFDSSIAIDGDAPLGGYTVNVSAKGGGDTSTNFTGSFEVQRYKLEKVKLAFDFPEKVIFRGETIKATLKASYYWGSPAVGETVDYTLPDGRTYSQETDGEGIITIDYDPSGFLPGRHLQFTALAKRYNVSASDQVFLAKLGFGATVEPSQKVALAGEPFDVTVTTKGADGEPVGKEMTLYVLRRENPKPDPILSSVPWIERRSVASGEVTVEEHEVTTDAKTGTGTVKLTLDKGGIYVLRASGEDRFGQVVTGQNSMTVTGEEDSVKLRFFADIASGKVGADLPVRLHSRIQDALALVTVEGEEIISYSIMDLKDGFNPVDLSLGQEHFPNFRLSVAAIDGTQLREATKDFKVERELKVKIVPRKEIDLPGAETTVDLIVTDQNDNPVEAALSLSLVNEALYSLYPERVAPILDFFQSGARRNAEFRVGSTCGFQYVGRTRAVVKSITEEKERLARRQKEMQQLEKLRNEGGYGLGDDMFAGRERDSRGLAGNVPSPGFLTEGEEPNATFADLDRAAGGKKLDVVDEIKSARVENAPKEQAAEGKDQEQPRKEVMAVSRWISPVVTNADGKAEVKIPLPESMTEWRLSAKGVSKDSLVGQAVSSMITRKDFFVELKTPVQVQEGDTMRFLAKIHNLTDHDGKVELLLEVRGEKTAVSRKTVDIKAQSVAECLFDGTDIPLVDSVKVVARAESGELSDALEIDLPVRPWGMEFASSAGGVSEGNASGIVTLPDGLEISKQKLEVTLSPSVETALIDFALRGGGSSTADGLLAAVSALIYAKEHDAEEKDIRVLYERAQSLAASLSATQMDDGYWAWNHGNDLYTTCRSYWALSLASKTGIPIHSDILRRTETVLNNHFSKLAANDNDNKSLILHALSVTGKADFSHLNRIYRERAVLSNNALAFTAAAMNNLDRKDFAMDLVELLEKKVQLEKDAPQDRPKIAWWDGSGYTVLRDRNETTAMVLLAVAGVKPESPLAGQAVNFLLRNRACFGFRSPQAMGSAVAALAEYYGEMEAKDADFEIDVIVNGKSIGKVRSAEMGRSKKFDVPAKLIKNGDNIVRFEKAGPGKFSYSVLLTGFSKTIETRNGWGNMLRFTGDHYRHDNLTYRGVPLSSSSTSPVSKIEVGQKIKVVSTVYDSYTDARREYRVREQFLPAGMLLVDGSVTGNFQHYEVGDGVITAYYQPGRDMGGISYELVGYAPGTYRVLPGTVRDFYNRERVVVGKSHTLTVLAPGEKSDDPYQMNHSEHFELARLNFDDGNFETALGHLNHLFKHNRAQYEKDLARMLLWIHTKDEYFEADKVVEMFEILRERHPSLTIPFDKILVVGKAYRLIGEFERAWLVFRATVDSSFINDASLSATLEDQGQFLGSIEYMDSIWKEYPDTSQVVSTYFALSQQLFKKAPVAHELKAEEERRRRARGDKKDAEPDFDRIGLLKRSLDYLHSFLTLYPTDPLADDAAFSMASAYFALEDYDTVVKAAEGFQKVYPKSSFVTSFQYMAALGHFWQYHYDKALAAAAPVTESNSKDRDYARYITAQIHHALGAPGKAIEWYEKVKSLYPDAADAIQYFMDEKIEMDEVVSFEPKEKVEIELRYRNIKEAYLQIYRVDLMKLYLREKNLSNITKVHLAGIEPEMEMTIDLGDGKDYSDRKKEVTLPLKEEGAYLVICRGDDLFTSSMVLVTPLKLEIQENPGSGTVRVNVRDTVNDGYQAKVHVKAIGSSDVEFKSGETDLRGIFVAEGLNGSATVIARQDGRYAFYRGESLLGKPQVPNDVPQQEQMLRQQLKQTDYLDNVIRFNNDIQDGNINTWNDLRRGSGGKGVEIQQAK